MEITNHTYDTTSPGPCQVKGDKNMDYGQTIVQLNNFPADKYNVLVPVTTMQVASNLQRITVSQVQLDVRQTQDNKGPSKDIYFEKSSGAWAITKVGG